MYKITPFVALLSVIKNISVRIQIPWKLQAQLVIIFASTSCIFV